MDDVAPPYGGAVNTSYRQTDRRDVWRRQGTETGWREQTGWRRTAEWRCSKSVPIGKRPEGTYVCDRKPNPLISKESFFI